MNPSPALNLLDEMVVSTTIYQSGLMTFCRLLEIFDGKARLSALHLIRQAGCRVHVNLSDINH